MGIDLKAAFDEAKDEVISTVKGRLGSPFVGAFVLSWVLWNHRLFFVLFSSKSVEMRFGYVDEVLYPDVLSFALLNLIGPLLTTATYIFVIPWITEFVIGWNLMMKRRVAAKEMKSENLRPLSEIESMLLRDDLGKKNRQINEKNDRNSKLTHQLAQSDAVIAALRGSTLLESKLKSFLCGGLFRLDTKHRMGGTTYVFDDDGYVKAGFEASAAIKGAARWKLRDRTQLVVMDVDGNDLATLDFVVERGCFVEQSGVGRMLELA